MEATMLAVVVVGLVELIKNFIPSDTAAKVKAIISVAISIACSVAFGLYSHYGIVEIAKLSVQVVGATQTVYNFVLKFLQNFKKS